jgi:uncharacterized protein (DUF302 family)
MEAERTVPPGMKRLRATGSVDASFARLEEAVAQRGLTVFARVDYAADAAAVGLVLRPTRLLLFGNPRAGTPLIVAAPTVALDLPLRVLVWEADDGTVWVGYSTPEYLAERHGVPSELLANVRAVGALAAIAAGTA